MEKTRGRGRARACMTTLAAATVLAFAGPAGASILGGAAEIIDGDGLMIGPVVVRIHGIDAPEIGQACNRRGGGTWRCDEAATALLEDLAGGRDVECEALRPAIGFAPHAMRVNYVQSLLRICSRSTRTKRRVYFDIANSSRGETSHNVLQSWENMV
jgi:hypothetical protein